MIHVFESGCRVRVLGQPTLESTADGRSCQSVLCESTGTVSEALQRGRCLCAASRQSPQCTSDCSGHRTPPWSSPPPHPHLSRLRPTALCARVRAFVPAPLPGKEELRPSLSAQHVAPSAPNVTRWCPQPRPPQPAAGTTSCSCQPLQQRWREPAGGLFSCGESGLGASATAGESDSIRL